MPIPTTAYFGSAAAAQTASALHKALSQMGDLQTACWSADAFVRIVDPQACPDRDDVLQCLNEVDEACAQLKKRIKRLACKWAQAHDDAALQGWAASPGQEAQLRQRIAQADQSLKNLYPQLLAVCQHALAPLQQEMQASQAAQPLNGGRVHVELDYMLDEADPQFDDKQDNILARQEVLWGSAEEGDSGFYGSEDQAMRIHDNWLDYPHRWMDRQCWLTHDVLEHNHGQNPRMGVAALLRTGRIQVDVHAVRSYVYDLRKGVFLTRDEEML